MATLAMIAGTAMINAIAFSGSNFVFSKLGSSDEERIRHDKALEAYTQEKNEWNKMRSDRIDYIQNEIRKEGHAEQTFSDVDYAMDRYYKLTGEQLTDFPDPPKWKDFYTPSTKQQNNEIVLMIILILIVIFIIYKYKKK